MHDPFPSPTTGVEETLNGFDRPDYGAQVRSKGTDTAPTLPAVETSGRQYRDSVNRKLDDLGQEGHVGGHRYVCRFLLAHAAELGNALSFGAFRRD